SEMRRYLFGGSEHWIIYVLELANGCFYIGSSKQLGKALGEHFNGRAIAWTRDNPVLKVAELIMAVPDMGSYLLIKQELLKKYIMQYGWDHVVGGQMPPKGGYTYR